MIPIYPRHTTNLSIRTITHGLTEAVRARNGRARECVVEEFESRFAAYVGVPHAVGVSSARVGLFTLLTALGLEHGDEVILPVYTFPAIPRVVRACGLTPVFVDVEKGMYTIDPFLIEEKLTAKTRVIVATHLFGQPCNMDRITGLAHKYGIAVVEDCAHALGAEYKGEKVGSMGDAGIFSFGIGKNLSCLGGGMVTTSDSALFAKIEGIARTYSLPANRDLFKTALFSLVASVITHPAAFPFTAFPFIYILGTLNLSWVDRVIEERHSGGTALAIRPFQLSQLQAVIGLRALESLPEIQETRIRNSMLLTRLLRDVGGIQLPVQAPQTKHVYSYYRILVENEARTRQELLRHGIDTKRDDMAFCADLCEISSGAGSYPVASTIPGRSIGIPNSHLLKESDMLYIARCITGIVQGQ